MKIILLLILFLLILQSGCALVNLPFQVVGLAFGVVGEAVKLAQRLPLPPGMFF